MTTDGGNQWFGKDWGAPFCKDSAHVATPVGKHCEFCKERIEQEDTGVILNNGTVPFHYECHIRSLVGSVGHQQHRCTCYGVDDVSEDGISARVAAIRATAYHEMKASRRSKRHLN